MVLLVSLKKVVSLRKYLLDMKYPDGSKVFGKNINDDPEKYFTKEVLDKIDEIAKRKFQYGSEEDEQ